MIEFPKELNGIAKAMAVLSVVGALACIIGLVWLLNFIFNHVTILID